MAWLVTKVDKKAICQPARISWRTVRAIAALRLDRWRSKAQRSRIPEFVTAARIIRKHRDGITATTDHGLSNGRHEGLNNKVRLLIRHSCGFPSAEVALATVMLACEDPSASSSSTTPPPTWRTQVKQ